MKGLPDIWRTNSTLAALSPLEKKHSIVYMTPRPSPPAYRPLASPSLPFDLRILRALQGGKTSWEDRQDLSKKISDLPKDNKKKLIDFIQGSKNAAESAVEGNACKAFQCEPSHFCFLLDKEEGAEMLSDHFQVVVSALIPTLESVLYPLQTSFKEFSIRRIILRCFRDQVLLRVFERTPYRIPRLEHLIFTVLFETHDNSLEYERFEFLANAVLGKSQ